MKHRKTTKEKSLEEKYGNSLLRSTVDEMDDGIKIVGESYYFAYCLTKRRSRRANLLAMVASILWLVLVICSIWELVFLFPATISLIIATEASVSARIENLWCMNYVDKITDTAVRDELSQMIEALDRKKADRKGVKKGTKKSTTKVNKKESK